MSKKAQSQIITTVLIILLVLAAIVIVWQVVNTTVEGGAGQVEAAAACIGVAMKVTGANGLIVDVMRESGGTVDAVGYKVLIDGVSRDGTNVPISVEQLESSQAVLIGSLSAGAHKYQVTGVIDGTSCGLSPEFTV